MRTVKRRAALGETSLWDEEWERESVEGTLRWNVGHDSIPIYDEFLPVDGRTLEAGCGLCRYVIHYQRKGYRIVGADSSMTGLRKAKEYDPSLDLLCTDLRQLPFPKESFDTYISVGVIEHYPEGPDALLKDAYRVLSPGGTILLDVPVDNRFYRAVDVVLMRRLRQVVRRRIASIRWLRKALGKSPVPPCESEVFDHFLHTSEELVAILQRAGFRVERTFHTCRSVGLWRAFPIFRSRRNSFDEYWQNSMCLNRLGRAVETILTALNSGMLATMVLCVARKD